MRASQMMAAKRAAKKESAVKKYARENIGNKRADRNKLANIATIHAMNKMAMHKGEPQSLDAQLTENIKNLMHYEAMVYGYDRISVTVFEKLIRAMRVVACIYVGGTVKRTGGALSGGSETLIVDIGATLSTGFGGRGVDSDQICNGNCVINYPKVRKLTPIECERLQGFPDNYTRIPWRSKTAEQCPDTPRYMAIGNSMAVPVIRWIGERICGT